MSSRTAAIAEWVVAGAVIAWMIVFFIFTQLAITMTLGIVISSVFIGVGLLVSLGINGAAHVRRRALTRAEMVFLAIEAGILLLLVVAGIADQLEYDRIVVTDMGSSFGHWLDWFLPLWLLLGPVALTVLILGLVNRSRATATPPSSSAR